MSQNQATALNEETYRKKIKRLTGEIDMFDAYSDSLYDIFLKIRNNKQSQASRTEITKVRDSFKLSVEYMREICQETGLSITEGKRI